MSDFVIPSRGAQMHVASVVLATLRQGSAARLTSQLGIRMRPFSPSERLLSVRLMEEILHHLQEVGAARAVHLLLLSPCPLHLILKT